MRYSQAIKKQAIELINAGKSARQTAKELKIPVQTLYSWTKTKSTTTNKPNIKAKTEKKQAIIKEGKTSKKDDIKLKLLEAENAHLRQKVALLESLL